MGGWACTLSTSGVFGFTLACLELVAVLAYRVHFLCISCVSASFLFDTGLVLGDRGCTGPWRCLLCFIPGLALAWFWGILGAEGPGVIIWVGGVWSRSTPSRHPRGAGWSAYFAHTVPAKLPACLPARLSARLPAERIIDDEIANPPRITDASGKRLPLGPARFAAQQLATLARLHPSLAERLRSRGLEDRAHDWLRQCNERWAA
jgi:hypothetical protein